MKKIFTMFLALSLISLTHSCQDEELEVQTVSVNPVEQEIIEEKPFTLDQINDPLLVNQYDNLNSLSKTILKEKLTTLYSDKVDLINWDSVILNTDYIYIENQTIDTKTYRFLVDMPRIESDEENFIPPLVNVRVNHDINNDNLINDLHINDQDISESLTFDLEGVVTNESSNDVVKQSARTGGGSSCICWVVRDYKGVLSRINWVTSSAFNTGGTSSSPVIASAPAAVWLQYARQTGNSQILSFFGIVRVAGIVWNQEISNKYMNPPSSRQRHYSLYLPKEGGGQMSFMYTTFFPEFPKIKNWMNDFYYTKFRYGYPYTVSDLSFDEHLVKQSFIDSFTNWLYKVKSQNYSLYQFFRYNPTALEKTFKLFAMYSQRNNDPKVIVGPNNPFLNYYYYLEPDAVKLENVSEFILENSDISLIRDYVNSDITFNELENVMNMNMIYESFPLTYPDGLEPIKPYVGTSSMFRSVMDNSKSKVGLYKGLDAVNYMLKLSDTEFVWSKGRPIPTQTGYFNKKQGRYIYTEKGGWIDMVHFLFYASKAYNYVKKGYSNPIGEAVQDGYKQELTDKYAAPHSAYSYEDLPSDKFGAEFAVKYFNPNINLTLGEQIERYLNDVLKATTPDKAPNYKSIPISDDRSEPTKTNTTTNPFYTK